MNLYFKGFINTVLLTFFFALSAAQSLAHEQWIFGAIGLVATVVTGLEGGELWTAYKTQKVIETARES